MVSVYATTVLYPNELNYSGASKQDGQKAADRNSSNASENAQRRRIARRYELILLFVGQFRARGRLLQ